MSKIHKNGRSKGLGGPGVWMPRHLTDSEAFKDLDPYAVTALFHVMRHFNGRNNGDIQLSARTLGERMKVSKTQAHRALKDLEEHGFIAKTITGFMHGAERHASRWRLTDKPDDAMGTPASQDYKRWQTKKKSPVPGEERSVPREERGVHREGQMHG